MKRLLLSLVVFCLSNSLSAQSPTFAADAASVEQSIKEWRLKNGYELVIKFNRRTEASFFAEAWKDYAVFFVYDIHPKQAVNFKVGLLNPSKELMEKYTAQTSDLFVRNSARVEFLTFSTPAELIDGMKQVPVKATADPKARIYIYQRKRR